MIYSVNQLRADTVSLITTVDKQIAELEELAKARDISVTKLINPDGSYALPNLLLAKATAYNTLVMLQTSEARPGHPGRR